MKIKKILTAMVAGVMSMSMVGSLAVNAEETEKLYTFSELLEMSKEEFLKLDGANVCYGSGGILDSDEEMARYHLKAGYYEVGFACNTKNSNDGKDTRYQPYITEKAIMELLDNIDYDMTIPLEGEYGMPRLFISHKFQDRSEEVENLENPDYIDESIFKFGDEDRLYNAKLFYCLNQVAYFIPYCSCVDGGATGLVAYGEANGDDKLTAEDAAFIARKLAEQKADELPKTADFNADGNITALDCAKIAQFLAAKSMAQAEGMIE